MKKHSILAALAALAGLCAAADAQALTPKQRQTALIAAFTANGDQARLKTALAKGLSSGLSVNETKEILTQLYAYTGFPRSLNAINTFMTLMQERQNAGIKDVMGPEASPMPKDLDKDAYGAAVRNRLAGRETEPAPAGYQLFTPVIDVYLKEHLFADIFYRDNLDFLSREIATVSALAALSGTQGQLTFHLGAAMNVGLTPQQAREWARLIKKRVGRKEGQAAQKVLQSVLENRKQ